MTRPSFSVKHILALQEHCCCRHVRAAHEEVHTCKQTSDKQLQNQEKLLRVEEAEKGDRGRDPAQIIPLPDDHSFSIDTTQTHFSAASVALQSYFSRGGPSHL